MRKNILLLVFFSFLSGCACVSKDILYLAMDVSKIQEETSNSLIKSIDDDLASENRNDEEKKVLNDLKDRLDYLKRGNQAIVKSLLNELSIEELTKLLKERDSILEK